MVKVSYKYGKMRGAMEMAAQLENKAIADMLRDEGSTVCLNKPKNAWEVCIPNASVLRVLQYIERTLANCTPHLEKLPKGIDAVYESNAYYNVYLMLFWSHLYEDILRKYAEITE